MLQSRLLRINDWPIAVKLISAMVMIAVLPLAVVSFVNNANTSSSLRDTIGESVAQAAATTMNQVSDSLGEDIRLMMTAAQDETLQQALIERNASYSGSEQAILSTILQLDEQWTSATDTSPLIQSVVNEDPNVNPVSSSLMVLRRIFPRHAEVFVTDRYGANVASTDRTSDYYQADEEWWQAAWNGGVGGIYIGEPEYDESAGVTAINIGVPVRTTAGEIIGVLRTTVDIQSISDIVSEVNVGETGRAVVVDQNGIVIVDPIREYVGQPLPQNLWESAGLAGKAAGWDEMPGLKGGEALVGHAQALPTFEIPDVVRTDWTTLVFIDRQEALAPVAASTRLALGSMALATLAAAALALLVTRGLTGQLNEITNLFGRIGVGEFDARAEVTSGDELGTVATSLNAMLDNTLGLIQTREERDAMQAAVQKLLAEVKDVSQGDLTVEAEVTADVTGAIADSFNLMIGQLREIISGVQDATLRVSSSANEIRMTTENLSQGSDSQAMQIADASAAIDEMATSIAQVSENAAVSATVGTQALANAQQGARAVINTMEGMNRIRDQVQETAKRIKRLGESSQEIGEIVQLIGDIADRTSILALNASIQAAMAGDAGRGFAVVAEEVERLAERSTEATKKIDMLIRTIQNETNEAVAAMEVTTNEVVGGSVLAEEAGRALGEIEAVSSRLAELSQSISLAAKQQARGSENLAKSMSDIAEVTQHTAAGTKQASVSISSLARLADELRESVSTFKMPGSNGHGPA